MRRASIIIAILVFVLVTCVLAVPRLTLNSAKNRAIEKYADGQWGEKALNTIPKAPPRRVASAADYQSTVWMKVADTECRLGFPSDRFRRDVDPKRENVVIHHQRYRALIHSGASGARFAPVMQPLGFTNLYEFVSSVFRTTERDIPRQSSMDALQRHTVLLDAKLMLAPVCFVDSCIEIVRDELKGFIVGDPARTTNLNLLVFIESKQQFIDLGVIQETPIQMSDLEELISVLKVGSTKSAAANRRLAEQAIGSDDLAAIDAADRVFPATVAELVRSTARLKH